MKIDFWNYKSEHKEIEIDEETNQLFLDEVEQSKGDCNSITPELSPYYCTRPAGHKGPHVACGGNVCAVWHESASRQD
jgi:hypothetical protein